MAIKIDNLSKVFVDNDKKNSKPIMSVSGVTADISDGKIVGLIGPSFSGKTSLLFMIAGLYVPTGGKIYFDDVDVTNLPPEKRDVGFVFQDYALYPHLTALENIMFPLLAKKYSKKEAKEKAREIAEFMGLGDILDKRPRVLSSHHKIQVAIARAFVKNPKVVLLDEPLANLDIRYRNETKELIKKLQRKTGIITIFVSHNQEDTISISDEIILMENGAIRAIGTPEDLYANPENQFVAEFLGNPAINTIQCEYNEDEESVQKAIELKESGMVVEEVVEDEGMPEIPKGILKFGDQIFLDDKIPAFGERMILTKDTRLLVRPEAFEINENGKYVMHVISVDFTGRDKIVKFTLPGLENEFNCLVPQELSIQPDTDTKFNFKRYFIFDTIGRRIK